MTTPTRILATRLLSGNLAVYEIEERKLQGSSYAGQTRHGRLVEYGRLLAVKSDGHWYNRLPGRASWVERYTNPETIAMFDACPLVDD